MIFYLSQTRSCSNRNHHITHHLVHLKLVLKEEHKKIEQKKLLTKRYMKSKMNQDQAIWIKEDLTPIKYQNNQMINHN